MSGCDNSKNTQNDIEKNVVIVGSTSVQPLSESLAEAFMKKNRNISIVIKGGGSAQGVKAIQQKNADLGALSREVKDEESSYITEEFIIASDGVAVITHSSNNVDNMSIDQIKKIYTGEIKNWKEVGGNDAPIIVVTREMGSGTRASFSEITGILTKNNSGEEVDETTKSALIQNSTEAVKKAVAETPNSIGYISLGSLGDSVKALRIEGKEPSRENVIDGEYKISRPFIYIAGNEISSESQKFIQYILSEDGQHLVEEMGFIPVI